MANYSWNWGLPDVQIPHPPVANSANVTTVPPAYHDLKFNPLGPYNLRRRLGVLVNEPAALDPPTSTDLLTVELTAANMLADKRLGVIVEYEDREDRFLEQEQELLEQQAQLQEQIKHLTERLKARPIPSTISSSLRSPPSTPARRTGAMLAPLTSPSLGRRTLAPMSPTPGRTLAARFQTPDLRTNLGPTTDTFLRENDLEHLHHALEVVVRQVAPVMYYEVHWLGLEGRALNCTAFSPRDGLIHLAAYITLYIRNVITLVESDICVINLGDGSYWSDWSPGVRDFMFALA
ncbi:hypothetical protein DFH09DRAFT_1316456 [Mycena vulgaris]|nr:hypothetical protein DFH09DRAFT_1316456 [Mycena vulgaris]